MEKIQSCVKTFLVCFENNSQNVTPPTPNLNYGFSQPFHNFSALSFFLYFRSHRVNGIVVVFVVGALLRPERLKVKARNRASSLRFLPPLSSTPKGNRVINVLRRREGSTREEIHRTNKRPPIFHSCIFAYINSRGVQIPLEVHRLGCGTRSK